MDPQERDSGPRRVVRAVGALGGARGEARVLVEVALRTGGAAAVLLDLEGRPAEALDAARACARAQLDMGAHIVDTFRAVDVAAGRGDRAASVVVVAIDGARGEVSVIARGGALVVVPPRQEPATLVTAFRAGVPPLRVHAFEPGAALLAATVGMSEDTTGLLALAARLELPRADAAHFEPGSARFAAAVADHARAPRTSSREAAVLLADCIGECGDRSN